VWDSLNTEEWRGKERSGWVVGGVEVGGSECGIVSSGGRIRKIDESGEFHNHNSRHPAYNGISPLLLYLFFDPHSFPFPPSF
jgi:hypothetical protein